MYLHVWLNHDPKDRLIDQLWTVRWAAYLSTKIRHAQPHPVTLAVPIDPVPAPCYHFSALALCLPSWCSLSVVAPESRCHDMQDSTLTGLERLFRVVIFAGFATADCHFDPTLMLPGGEQSQRHFPVSFAWPAPTDLCNPLNSNLCF